MNQKVFEFKEWIDRKKYSQEPIDKYFSKPQNSPSSVGVFQRKTCYK